MLNILKNTINRVFASGVDSDASAFITATGLSGTTQKSAITTLVKDLKASGLWSKMKAVYPMVTDNYNLLSYTEDFTNAYWSNYQLTATNNVITAPNGTLTGNKLTETSANDYHVTQVQLGTLTANATFTASTSLKYIDRRYAFISFYLNQSPFPNIKVTVDLLNKSIVSSVGASASIILQDNNWFRVSVTGVVGNYSTNLWYQVALLDDSLNPSYLGTGKSMYIWGAQLEYGNLSNYQKITTTPSAFMASQMKYNLKDARDLDSAFRLTWSGGWTYSATGATPNGTNAYADTKLAPSANFSANNSSFSFYSRTENTNGGDVIGTATVSSNRCFMYIRYGANQSQINHNSGSTLNPVAPTSLGIFLSSRTSLGHRYFVNNALSASNSALETGLSTVSFYIGADNTNGSATAYTNRQVAFSHIGDGLTDQDAFLLNQIVEKYQVALSRGVQAAQSFYYNSAYSNEANTYLYSTQITGTTQVSAINTLINGLKANNLWSKMKAVYPFVTDKTLQSDMAAQMKFNLVNPQDSDAAFRLAFSGGWTYSTNGAQPNGTNGYADTKLVPSSVLGVNNTHISSYIRNTSQGVLLGTDSAYRLWIAPNFNGTQKYLELNTGTSTTPSSSISSLIGLWLGSRISAASSKLYNSANINYSHNTSSVGLDTSPIYISARNVGVASNYSSGQTAFVSIGDGLTDAEEAILNQLVTDYETTLNRNV